MVVRSHCHHVAEMYRLFANYVRCAKMCDCCGDTARKRYDERWAVRKQRRQWYDDEHHRRRARERRLYGHVRGALSPVLASSPLHDPPHWSAHNGSHLLDVPYVAD
mmetsp:Transcript_22872/g.55888  ORF Transcript_22872/g.55888 Transcript_22872/m.55888 type:complete len:106 (+) Transcript_22872:1-318(+)